MTVMNISHDGPNGQGPSFYLVPLSVGPVLRDQATVLTTVLRAAVDGDGLTADQRNELLGQALAAAEAHARALHTALNETPV